MEVRVFEAKGLLAADAGGTSDPFAVVKVLDEERNPLCEEEEDDKKKKKKKKKKSKPIPDRKTDPIKKTLEPRWNEAFTYERAPPPSSFVQVVIFDDDRFGKDPLGYIEIAVVDLTRGTTSDKWYSLLTVSGMKAEATGQLRVAISVAADGETIEELGIRRFEEMILGWDPHPDGVEHEDGDHVVEQHEGEPNELRVAVIKARDLPVMDKAMFSGSGSSDPIVKVTVGRQKQCSSVKKKTLEPIWREVLMFETDDDNDVVDIVLEDWDLVGSNDFMGKVSVQVGSLRGQHTQRQWHALLPKSGRLEDLKAADAAGEVELALKWAYNPTRDPNRLFEGLKLTATPDMTPNELHVAVIKGRGLLAMDKSMTGGAGTSDPLVKLECGDHGGPHGAKAIFKTKSVSKSLDPKWEETFAFHLPSAELGGPAEPPPLSVTVEDWDLTGNDFMGKVEIPLQELHDQHTERAWYPLVGKEGVFDRERGQIQLLIKWVFNPNLELTYFDGDDDGHPDKPPNELRVCLVQARNLPIMDKNLIGGGGSSDPLARCKVGDMPEVTTVVKKKTLEPVWNEVFSFEVKNSKLDVDIIVDDWDKMSGNDFIGMARVPLKDLANKQPISKWLTLAGKYPKKKPTTGDAKPDYSKPRGDVEVALHWWYNPELDRQFFREYDDDQYPELSPNQLLVAVTHAKDLLVMDKSMFSSGPGSSDPLVKLRITGSDEKLLPPKDERRKWVKTEVQKKTTHPIWNESFNFDLSADEHLDSCNLELEVEDWDRVGSNDFMGRLVLPLGPFVDKRIHVEEHELLDKKGNADKHRGVLEIVVRWVYNPTLYPKYFLDDDDGNPDKHPNELKVAIVRARNLNIMDAHFIGKGGSSDPVVKLSCDDSEYSTGIKKKDLHPVWNETFAIPVTDDALSLTLNLEDWDQIGSNDFMGRLVFPLKDLSDRKVRQRWYPLGGPRDSDLAEEEVGEDGKMVLVKPPDKDRGELEVAVKWWYNAELNPQFFIGEADAYPGRAPNELRICVVRGVNLMAMDTNLFSRTKGTSDPYVKLRIGDETPVQTTVIKKNLAPMWCEMMAIPALNVDVELEVTVMDWDLAGSHDFMGRVIIPLEPLFDKEPDQSWHVLGGKEGAEDGESRGEVELSLHWWFNPELEPDFFLELVDNHHLREPNELHVAVIQARGLPGMGSKLFGGGKTCDPLVRVKCGSEKEVRTKTKKKQIAPVWNEVFEIAIEDPEATAKFTIEDWGFTGNTLIGTVEVPLAKMHSKFVERHWFTIRKKENARVVDESLVEHDEGAETPMGRLEVAFRWMFNPALSKDYFTEDDGFPDREVNELSVAVIQARSLPAVDRKAYGSAGGCADPQATVVVGRARHRTEYIKMSLAPKWDSVFKIPLTEEQGLLESEFLEVMVEDWDFTSNDFMGAVRIQLAPLAEDRKLLRQWFVLGDENGAEDSMKRGRIELAVRWQYNKLLDPNVQNVSEYEWDDPTLTPAERRAKILTKCRETYNISDRSKELTLRRIKVDLDQAHLIKALLSLDHLRLIKIDLRESGLCPKSISVIAKGLIKNDTLEQINISRNKMADLKLDLGLKGLNPSVKDISGMLSLNSHLLRLDLSESSIEPLGLKAVAEGLKVTNSLRTLSLRANPLCNVNFFAWGKFDVSGLEAFAQALKLNVSLEFLNIGECQLCGYNKGGDGSYEARALQHIAMALHANRTLRQLDLSDNYIFQAGGKPLVHDIMRYGGFKLYEKLDKGNRVYCMLRRNMEQLMRERKADFAFLELFWLPSQRHHLDD